MLHDVDLAAVWQRLRAVRPLPFVGAVALATATFPLRTVRWRYLLRLEGETLPFVPLWHATAIGFAANNLIPARVGELARAYAAQRLTGSPFSAAFASIAVERVLDGITLVSLLTVAIWAGGFAPGTTVGGMGLGQIAQGAGTLFASLLLLALVVVHWPRLTIAVARGVATRILPSRWAERTVAAFEGLLAGLDALRSPLRFAIVAVWSLVVWLVAAASFGLAFLAFELDAPWSAALLLQALIAFGVAIPSSPGFFGPFEAVCRVTLALYGITATDAVSYAVGYHLATFLPITLLGIWSLSRARMHLTELRQDVGGAAAGSRERQGAAGNT